jgi:ion channel-forming bestrophin family protein
MQILRNRSIKEVVLWTRGDIIYLLCFASVPTFLYQFFGWKWLALPWLPIALIGTAVSFIVSFKNNASYERSWEARRIWGSIVNTSRAFASSILGYIELNGVAESETRIVRLRLIKRHVAWLTALRFQLREPRQWETMGRKHNAEYKATYSIDEHENSLSEVLGKYLPEVELNQVVNQSNKAAQILAIQSAEIKELHNQGLIDGFKHVSLQNIINSLYDHQGGSERIKNYPYPRQYATLNLFYVWIFAFLVPFGMLEEFENKLGSEFVWLTIPFATLAGWIFTTMEKVGESTENPFEGSANDIPITQISRNIEIDLLEMLGEKNLPPALNPVNDIIM